jgi:quinol monooxygenase YgiN
MARYKVHRDKLQIVRKAITEFVEAIAKNEPETIYEANQADDELTFIHIASFPDEVAETIHRKAEYTDRFVEVLYPCCEQLPEFLELRLIKGAGGKSEMQ